MNTRELARKYELELYPKRDITLVRGKGAKLWDDSGKEYIDCIGGQGSVNIGHCNDQVVAAVNKQISTLISCPGSFDNDARSLFFERLASIAPTGLNRFFLCNSGCETMEAAIKFARFTTKRTDFVAFTKAFHGRSYGALSATHNPKYREGLEPLVPGFSHVPFNDIEKLENAVSDKTAGIMIEPVQGEGGVFPATQEFMDAAARIAKDKGALLIVDEVQTAFCRTGKMFASEIFGITPDILCVAKSIAGGIPMGAVLVSDKIEIESGKHGTTFGGNPIACAAATAAIDFMMSTDLANQAAKKGEYLVGKIRELNLPIVREVRHLGLMIGIQLRTKSPEYIKLLGDHGVLALQAGPTVIRLLPPLVIDYPEMDFVINTINKTLSAWVPE